MNKKEIQNILNNTEYTIDDYLNIYNKMLDKKSKKILFNRVMFDNTDDPYYCLMMQKSAIEGDSLNSLEDKLLYNQLLFLLKDNNYNKKIYVVGYMNYEFMLMTILHNSNKKLNIELIFDNIEDNQEIKYYVTNNKSIDVVPIHKIYDYDFNDSIVIFINSDYIYLRDELVNSNKIDYKNTFVFYIDMSNAQNIIYERNIQYFCEPFLNFKENEIFIDGGAWIFDSSLNFYNYVFGQYEKIYSFEPMYNEYLICKEEIENNQIHDVEMFNLGLSNTKKELNFISDYSSSRESEYGDIIVNADSIDNILDGRRASIIKLDIEGAEYDALLGAEKTIKKYKPILMICVYHKPNDIIKLTKLILSYNNNYKIYARHYAYMMYETVLYFINKP